MRSRSSLSLRERLPSCLARMACAFACGTTGLADAMRTGWRRALDERCDEATAVSPWGAETDFTFWGASAVGVESATGALGAAALLATTGAITLAGRVR